MQKLHFQGFVKALALECCMLTSPSDLQDAQSVAWLERTLAAFKGTVVAVTHDR